MTWVLLTSGRGPGECQLAVAGFHRILMAEGMARGLLMEVVNWEEGQHGPLSVLTSVEGKGAEEFAMGWEGSLLWTCASPIRDTSRRKNWFVGSSVVNAPTGRLQANQCDIRMEAFRSSGPGGQHVNKTESAVRLVHVPTGITVTAREERSQHRNRALAMGRLYAEINAMEDLGKTRAGKDAWQRHNLLERGKPRRHHEGPGFRKVC